MPANPIANPVILKWAREKQGITLETIASRFKKDISEIEAWESGEGSPTYIQLERLAYELYKRPVALFFFPEPPSEESLSKSFRTLPEMEIAKISPMIRSLVRKAKAAQIGLLELIGVQENQKNIVREVHFSTKMSIGEMAKKAREYLGISIVEQCSWQNSGEALKKWRTIFEGKGVFIFKEAFRSDDLSGFCLHDENFPLIYLNNSQSDNRQIFTMFHELAHLLFGVGGIDPNSNEYLKSIVGEAREIEIFCNQFAGVFLVPDETFDKDIQNRSFSEELISNLANKYNVSREVILRKFLSRNIINEGQYKTFVQKWKEEWIEIKEEQKNNGGGNWYNNQGVYISEHYAGIVFQKHYQNIISLPDVANYLGVKIKSIEGIEASFSKKWTI